MLPCWKRQMTYALWRSSNLIASRLGGIFISIECMVKCVVKETEIIPHYQKCRIHFGVNCFRSRYLGTLAFFPPWIVNDKWVVWVAIQTYIPRILKTSLQKELVCKSHGLMKSSSSIIHHPSSSIIHHHPASWLCNLLLIESTSHLLCHSPGYAEWLNSETYFFWWNIGKSGPNCFKTSGEVTIHI